VVKELGEEDPALPREIGVHIGRLHQSLLPDDFIRAPRINLPAILNRFWLTYHDQGSLSLVKDGEDLIIRINSPLNLTESYIECVAGWIESLMIAWGIKKYVVVSSDEPMEIRMIWTGTGNSIHNSK
ncbi:MAG: hypothetical protein ACPL68_03915, partial [Candidatus Hydrothermia bacterium]